MGMCICMYIYLYLHVFLWKALCTRECVCTCICVCVRAHSLLLVCGCAHRAKWRLQCLFRRQDSGSRLSASTLQHFEKHIHVIVLFLVHKEKKERAQSGVFVYRQVYWAFRHDRFLTVKMNRLHDIDSHCRFTENLIIHAPHQIRPWQATQAPRALMWRGGQNACSLNLAGTSRGQIAVKFFEKSKICLSSSRLWKLF